MCVSIGVPYEVLTPPLLSSLKYGELMRKCGARDGISVEVADEMAWACRLNDTALFYDTHGAVSADNRLLSIEHKWTVKPPHRRFLKALLRRCHPRVTLSDLVALDTCFHLKRARARSNVASLRDRAAMMVPRASGGSPRLFVYYECMCTTEVKRDRRQMAAWFEISRSLRAPPRNLMESPAENKRRSDAYKMHYLSILVQHRAPTACVVCGLEDDKAARHWKCSGCDDARYCSDACQRSDWSRHKHNCHRAVF